MALNESKKSVKETADKFLYKCPECGYVHETDKELDSEVACPECKAKITKECKTTMEDLAKESAEVEDDFVDQYVYQCPECDEYFTSPIQLTGCVCPECEAEVTPVFIGDAESVDVAEATDLEEGALTELVVKVRGGKVIKMKKKPRPGYKLVNGKYVKMSAKERRARKKAIKKAQKKANKGAAKVARKKSMRLRARRGLNDNFKFENESFCSLVNACVASMFESVKDQYYVPTVESVTGIFMEDEDLVIECAVKYEDGETGEACFTVENFKYEDGTYVVKESGELIDFEGSMNMVISVTEGVIEPKEFNYDLKVGDAQVTESFELTDEE